MSAADRLLREWQLMTVDDATYAALNPLIWKAAHESRSDYAAEAATDLGAYNVYYNYETREYTVYAEVSNNMSRTNSQPFTQTDTDLSEALRIVRERVESWEYDRNEQTVINDSH